MTTTLQRTMFETSRAAEYFNARELQAQTGQLIDQFATVALKELVDNALDACETANVAPTIRLKVHRDNGLLHVSVEDNGSGVHPETVRRILNLQTRTSDKAAYRAPTRGGEQTQRWRRAQQGRMSSNAQQRAGTGSRVPLQREGTAIASAMPRERGIPVARAARPGLRRHVPNAYCQTGFAQ